MASSQEIDLVLLGKTGNGKSATGNSILMRKAFKINSSTTSVTKIAQYEVCKFEGRVIQVVDAPGTNDTDSDPSEALTLVTQSLTQAMITNPQGYHAFLVVLKYGTRYTKEEQSVITILKGILGDHFLKEFGIIVMCGGDHFLDDNEEELVDFKQYCLSQSGCFQELLKECNYRIILFDNKTKDKATQYQQVKRLVNMVDQLPSDGERYTNKHFKKAEKKRNHLYVTSLVPMIEKETLTSQRIILDEIKLIQTESCEQKKIDSLQKLLPQIEKLITQIEVKDRGTGALNKILENVEDVRKTVNDHIRSNTHIIRVRDEIKAKEEKMKKIEGEEVEKIKEELEKEMLKAKKCQDEERQKLLIQLEEQERKFTEIKEEADKGFFSKAASVCLNFGKGLAVAAGAFLFGVGGAARGLLVGAVEGMVNGVNEGGVAGGVMITPLSAMKGAFDGAVAEGSDFIDRYWATD